MQALIDYDGWRKWKTFTDDKPADFKDKPKPGKKKTNRASISRPPAALAEISNASPEQQALVQAVQAPATDAIVDGAVELDGLPPPTEVSNESGSN